MTMRERILATLDRGAQPSVLMLAIMMDQADAKAEVRREVISMAREGLVICSNWNGMSEVPAGLGRIARGRL